MYFVFSFCYPWYFLVIVDFCQHTHCILVLIPCSCCIMHTFCSICLYCSVSCKFYATVSHISAHFPTVGGGASLYCAKCNPYFRYITRNIEENEILHEMFRIVCILFSPLHFMLYLGKSQCMDTNFILTNIYKDYFIF